MNKSLALNPRLVILFIASWAFANLASAQNSGICQSYRCEKFEPTKICLVDAEAYTDFRFKAAARTVCGRNTPMHLVHDDKELQSILTKYATSCKRISELVIHGHSSPGFLNLAGILPNSVRPLLGGYDCLMEPNAEVKVTGCNSGKGCAGGLLMYRLAETLLTKGGTLTAATSYTIPGFSSTIPL